jgi:hypothetical protein
MQLSTVRGYVYINPMTLIMIVGQNTNPEKFRYRNFLHIKPPTLSDNKLKCPILCHHNLVNPFKNAPNWVWVNGMIFDKFHHDNFLV